MMEHPSACKELLPRGKGTVIFVGHLFQEEVFSSTSRLRGCTILLRRHLLESLEQRWPNCGKREQTQWPVISFRAGYKLGKPSCGCFIHHKSCFSHLFEFVIEIWQNVSHVNNNSPGPFEFRERWWLWRSLIKNVLWKLTNLGEKPKTWKTPQDHLFVLCVFLWRKQNIM